MKETEPHPSMRGYFAYEVHKHMKNDSRIWVVTGDLGYGMWDQVKRDYPGRFLNVGAAEQALLGVGVGLALEGRIPILYSITPFLLYRPFETISLYLQGEGIPVKLAASGRDRDYHDDGPSHWAEEDGRIMEYIFGDIVSRWPLQKEEIPSIVDDMINTPKPYYISLKR